jgi:hypothetical protein
MTSEQDSRKTRRTPLGVMLVAGVQALNAATLAVHLAVAESDPNMPIEVPGDPGVLASFFVGLGIVTAFGLWCLQRWAWVATMLWAGLTMAAGLWAYALDEPVSYPVMALTLLQVFYLNLSEVQEAFVPDALGRQAANERATNTGTEHSSV